MFNFKTWLVPATLTLVGFGSIAAPANAQTNYLFNDSYNVDVSITNSFAPDIFEIALEGNSTNASFGLNNIAGTHYIKVDSANGPYFFTTDPSVFSLAQPPGGFVISGTNSSNQLFGSYSGSVSISPDNPFLQTASGTFNIAGGQGIFTNATGTLNFSAINLVSSTDPTVANGTFSLNGNITTPQAIVPEPTTTAASVLALAGLGVGLRLKRKQKSGSLVKTNV